MKKYLVLVLAIALLATFGLAMAQQLPGSGWESGQQVQNIGDGEATISFLAYSSAGASTDCGTQSADPGASVNYLTSACDVAAGFQGSAVVSSNQPIAAIVNVNNRTVGSAAGQYQGTSGEDAATTIAFPLVKNNFGGRTTTFYVQNASGSANDITATFTTGPLNGATTDYELTFDAVPAYAMVVVSPDDADVPTGDLGSLTVVGTQPLAGTSLEHEASAAVAQNLQGSKAFTPNGYDATAYCPLVRNAHTSRGQTTGIQVQNVSGAAQTVTVEYSYSIGGGAIQTDSVTSPELADGESFTFFGADATYGLPVGALGSAIVTGNGGNIAAVVNDRGFSATPFNPVTTYACFPASAATNEAVIPLYKEYFFGNTSGIQIQNIGDATATLEVTYSPVGGDPVVFSAEVAAGSSTTFFGVSQLASPADISVVSGTASSLVNSYGGVTISSDQPIVAIANESSFGGFGTTASGQDTKNYEGFNK